MRALAVLIPLAVVAVGFALHEPLRTPQPVVRAPTHEAAWFLWSCGTATYSSRLGCRTGAYVRRRSTMLRCSVAAGRSPSGARIAARNVYNSMRRAQTVV